MQPAKPGANPQETLSRMCRSSDGKIRCDSGHTTVITDLASRQTIMIDHLAKEAQVFPMQQIPGAQFGQAALAAAATPPSMRLVNVQDLGKSFIEGQEVVGKRFTFQPPGAPAIPSLPQPPAFPAGQPPGMPNLPQPPLTVSEVWTSTKLELPVLTKTTGSFGEQVQRCRYTESGEPSASVFQIPQGYKPPVVPTPPTPPNVRR